MHLTLWIATGLLAAVALVGGVSKTLVPRQRLSEHPGGAWTADVSTGFVKTLGVLELLAVLGLTLPAAFDVAPVMVPVTALCWIGLMVGAMITHGRLGQFRLVMVNLVYLSIAAFVAWGRLGPEPFTG